MLRLWFLILCVIAGAFARSRAHARGVENRTRDFFAETAKTQWENLLQVVEPHQERPGHDYKTVSASFLATGSEMVPQLVQQAQGKAPVAGDVLYRGVAKGSVHDVQQAAGGAIVPRGGSSSAYLHTNEGMTSSPFTSWTPDVNVAKRFAGTDGPIFSVNQNTIPNRTIDASAFSRIPSEKEILIEGTVYAAETTAGKSLLPGEGLVGSYDDLIAAGSKGDNITPHHIPSANRMSQAGVSRGDAIAINMEQPFPGGGGRHRATFTYGTTADASMPARGAFAAGVRDARQIYINDGLCGPTLRQALQDLIQTNKQTFPQVFAKPPRAP